MQDNEHSAWYYIKGGLFLIWFVASIIALFWTAKLSPWLAVSVFGQYFLVIGLIVLVSGIKDGNLNPIFLTFVFVGLLAVTFGIVMCFGSESAQQTFKELIPYAGISIFFVTGILLIISYFVHTVRDKNCIEPVLATCVDMKKRKQATSDGYSYATYYTYCPVLGFRYNGKDYEVNTNFYSQHVDIELGEQRELYINPKYPKCFRQEGEAAHVKYAELIFGIIFTVISSFVFLLLIALG